MGKYLPSRVHSAELEERLSIPRGWSEKYSGVESRHHVTFEHNDYMGARAAEQALEKAGMSLRDIDMVIYAGGTFDYAIPNQASLIKNEMSEGQEYHPECVDIDCTCLSFIAAMNFSSGILDGEQYRNILLVSSEISSKHLNPNNWETSTLFGDAAVAAVVTYSPDSGSQLIKGGIRTYSQGVLNTVIKGGGLKNPFSEHPYDVELHSFQMEGRQLLKLARQKIPEFMMWFFQNISYSFESAPVIIPHQASKMGMVLTESLFDLRPGQMKSTLKEYGNCIAASIPLTLHDCIENGELKRGDLCLLSGTSAGFSVGASLLVY
jgi:3-oxoacyl-[acyl-carrier-protein] synthase-3